MHLSVVSNDGTGLGSGHESSSCGVSAISECLVEDGDAVLLREACQGGIGKAQDRQGRTTRVSISQDRIHDRQSRFVGIHRCVVEGAMWLDVRDVCANGASAGGESSQLLE